MASVRLPLLVLASVCCCQAALTKLKVLHSWESIDYHWSSHHPNATRQKMIKLGLFIPGNAIPFDVDWWNGRTFVTTPRLKPGVPATLSTITPYGDEVNPVLHPYPNWSWHRPGDCEGITSVSSIKVDRCGNLWVLDTGTVGDKDHTHIICPKKLLVFKLSKDKMIRSHSLPDNILRDESELNNIVVDHDMTEGKCSPTFAYIADSSTNGLLVYDRKEDRSWRATANNFYPLPTHGNFEIAGSKFNKMIGIYDLALSPEDSSGQRKLYYCALSSNTLNYVLTEVLQQKDRYTSCISAETKKEFQTYTNTKSQQSSGMAMDSEGVLYFSYTTDRSLNCWKSSQSFDSANIVELETDDDKLQFVSSIKIIRRKDGSEDVMVISNRLQKILDKTMKNNETNYRIMKVPISELIAGTKCALP